MDIHNLKEFNKGWFIGNFYPTLWPTSSFETALKTYNAGDSDPAHFHKVAVEYTLVIHGEVEMNGVKYVEDDIIIVYPNEIVKFTSLTNSKLMVVKTPSVQGDKYIV